MVVLNTLPEATFTNYLMLNISRLPLFKAIILYSKEAAVLFVILDMILKYLKAKGTGNPFTAFDFVRPLVLVTVVCTYDILMSSVDYGVTQGDLFIAQHIGTWDNYKSTLPNIPTQATTTPNSKNYTPPKLTPTKTDPSVEGGIYVKLNEIASYVVHPGKILTAIFEFIGNFFSSLIYSSALLIRAFGLFFLRVMGPLFIILSIFEKFKDSMWQWLRYYIIFTVWIIPFYLVNIFFDYVYAQSRTLCQYGGFMNGEMYGVSISMIAIFVKFTVAKGSFTWLKEIITFSHGDGPRGE